MRDRIKSRYNIMKSLTSTVVGSNKLTLLIFYQAAIRFPVHYSAPVWINHDQRLIEILEVIKNNRD